MLHKEILTFILVTYNSAAVPLRLAYAFWAGFFFLYWYASLHDKYARLTKPRELKDKNFPKVLLFFGIACAFLHHGATWFEWRTYRAISTDYEVSLVVGGLIFMSVGLFSVAWARAVLDGYWGPNIYKYKQPEDNILIRNGIYAYIRHPVYLGQILMTIGTLCLSNSLVFVFFPVFVIPITVYRACKEDRELLERFGDEFVEYKRTTESMIPGVI